MELFTLKKPLILLFESFGTLEVFVKGLVVLFLAEPSETLAASLAKDRGSAAVAR